MQVILGPIEVALIREGIAHGEINDRTLSIEFDGARSMWVNKTCIVSWKGNGEFRHAQVEEVA